MECKIKFKVGDTHKIYMAPNFYKIHIVAIIDENYIVYKWYGRHKQWWHYKIEPDLILETMINCANNLFERKQNGISNNYN